MALRWETAMTEIERNLKLQRLDCAIQKLEVEAASLRMRTEFTVSDLMKYEKCEMAKIEYRQARLGQRKEDIHMEYAEAVAANRFEE